MLTPLQKYIKFSKLRHLVLGALRHFLRSGPVEDDSEHYNCRVDNDASPGCYGLRKRYSPRPISSLEKHSYGIERTCKDSGFRL
jgi:hypothetical protein